MNEFNFILTVITFLTSLTICVISSIMFKVMFTYIDSIQKKFIVLSIISTGLYSIFQFRWIMDYNNIIDAVDEIGWSIGELLFCVTISVALYGIYKEKRAFFQKEEVRNIKNLIMSISCFILITIYSLFPSIGLAKDLKIVEVHSYTPDYVCTYPQREEFHNYLKPLQDKGLRVEILSFYMNTKVENTSLEKKKQISQDFINQIMQIKPDYIFTTDDAAFEYVGIPLLSEYKIFASGLNRPISEYNTLYQLKLENLFAVEELFRLDQLYRLYETIDITYPHYYFILEDINDMSETSVFMEKNYRTEVLGKGTITNIHIKSMRDLDEKIEELNKKPFGVIVVIAQRAKTDDGSYLGKEDIVKHIIKHNKKHIELGGNPDFSMLGISVCCSPSFYSMGETCGKKLVEFVNEGKFSEGVVSALNKVVVNKKRLDELKLSKIYMKQTNLISNVIESY